MAWFSHSFGLEIKNGFFVGSWFVYMQTTLSKELLTLDL